MLEDATVGRLVNRGSDDDAFSTFDLLQCCDDLRMFEVRMQQSLGRQVAHMQESQPEDLPAQVDHLCLSATACLEVVAGLPRLIKST